MEMEIKMKKLGFGTMRLPVLNQEDPASVDLEQVCKMVDTFMERGFTYLTLPTCTTNTRARER